MGYRRSVSEDTTHPEFVDLSDLFDSQPSVTVQ